MYYNTVFIYCINIVCIYNTRVINMTGNSVTNRSYRYEKLGKYLHKSNGSNPIDYQIAILVSWGFYRTSFASRIKLELSLRKVMRYIIIT